MSLGFPFDPYEQAPFVSRGIPAVTVTTAGARRPGRRHDARSSTSGVSASIGLAAQDTVDAMEQGVSLAQGPTSYVFLGQRLIRGWTIEIVLVAMLLPFLAAAVDLFARCRRRRIRIAPALAAIAAGSASGPGSARSSSSSAAIGLWGSATGMPPPLSSVSWPGGALVALVLLAGAGWLVARSRLLPRRPIRPEEQLAGHSGALLALGVVGLLVAATNPFALVLRPPLAPRLALAAAGADPPSGAARKRLPAWASPGPAYLVWSFATHYGLGWDAPWYVLELFAVGYAPLPLF